MTRMYVDRLLNLEKNPSQAAYASDVYDLSGLKRALGELGNRQNELIFVHIAGTKGKGSTGAFLESIFGHLGYSTAFYMSPHYVHFGERFRIDGNPWSIERYVEHEASVVDLVGLSAFKSAFELSTAVAIFGFAEFQKQLKDGRIQVVVWETGLGGRLDCTNVVTPIISVITRIGIDHTALLGNEVKGIAAEKAGIIKPGVPTVLSHQYPAHSDAVQQVIRRTADSLKSDLIFAEERAPVLHDRVYSSGRKATYQLKEGPVTVVMKTRANYQVTNAQTAIVTAIEVSEMLNAKWDIEGLVRGIETTVWPGRFESVFSSSSKELILDGAHCPLSATYFSQSLLDICEMTENGISAPFQVVFTMQADKDIDGFLISLLQAVPAGFFSTFYCYPLDTARGATAEMVADAVKKQGLDAVKCKDVVDAVTRAYETNQNTVAIGTLYSQAAVKGTWQAMS